MILMALIIVYFWAGITVLYALWLIEVIGQNLNGLLPEEKQLKVYLRKKPVVMVIVFFAWPVALPIWWFEMRAKP